MERGLGVGVAALLAAAAVVGACSTSKEGGGADLRLIVAELCTQDEQCATNACAFGRCHAPCTSPEQCPSRECVDDDRKGRSVCALDGDCDDGHCDGGSPADASPSDGGGIDASASDAGVADTGSDAPMDAMDFDAAGCLASPQINPVTSYATLGPGNFDAGAFGCGNAGCDGAFAKPVVATVLEFTRESRFAGYITHDSTSAGPWQLRSGCDSSSTLVLAGSNGAPDYHTQATVLEPGLYTFVQCCGYGAFVAAPTPTSANTNTSCPAAVALTTSATPATAPVRTWSSAETHYFTYKTGLACSPLTPGCNPAASPPGDNTITVDQTVKNAAPYQATGYYRLEVRTTCSDPATDVFDSGYGSWGWTNGGAYAFVVKGSSMTWTTTYYVVLSQIDPGLQQYVYSAW
jgi:hypothetical protein